MSLLGTLYQAGLVVAGLLCLGLAVYAWRNRERRNATYLVGLLASILVWIVLALVIHRFSGTPVAIAASRAWYVGITGAVLFFLLLALQYTGREQYITRRNVAILLVQPVFTNVAAWVPPLRDQFLMYGATDPATFTGYAVQTGPLWLAHTVYSYFLLASGAALLVLFAVRSEKLYRQQVLAVLVALVGAWGGNAVYLLTPINVDVTPLGFAITGIALWWAVFSRDFLTILPVARSTVVENIGAGVFVLDRNGTVIDVNDAGRELFEMGDEQLVGRDASAILDGFPAVRERFEAVADTTEPVDTEVSFGERHYRVQVTPLEDTQGALVGRLFLVSDITDQQRRQRELEHQNEQLEQFAKVVSHDLRNPLNVATGKVQLSQMQAEDDDLEADLDDAEQALDRMSDIIDDVLTLAREGKSIDSRERVSLEGIAGAAWQSVDAPEATLDVVADREFDADPDRLQRALENLFRNSVDHGRSDVAVTVGATSDGFYVADDGPGIPEDERGDVFENGYTTSDDGTGFGLAIVESIVEAHGWEIAVGESESGGARFEVTGVPVLADRDPPAAGSRPAGERTDDQQEPTPTED